MSLSELLVIVIVAFFAVKSEDFPHITKKIGGFFRFFTKTKKELLAYLDVSYQNSVAVDDDLEKINFYLEKISTLGGKYEGEYSLDNIKDYYQKLVKKSIKSEAQSQEITEVKESK